MKAYGTSFCGAKRSYLKVISPYKGDDIAFALLFDMNVLLRVMWEITLGKKAYM